MSFGTYENPAEVNVACGFDDNKEQQLLAMLAFRDVHAVRTPEEVPGPAERN